jgi:hypothetical protein
MFSNKTQYNKKHELYVNIALLLSMINDNDIIFIPILKINRGKNVSITSINIGKVWTNRAGSWSMGLKPTSVTEKPA